MRQSGKTALLQAAGDGRTDTARLLLDRGANVNHVDMVSAACTSNSALTVCIHALFVAGKFKRTALQRAVCSGHTDTVRLLLDRGANVNHGDMVSAACVRAMLPSF